MNFEVFKLKKQAKLSSAEVFLDCFFSSATALPCQQRLSTTWQHKIRAFGVPNVKVVGVRIDTYRPWASADIFRGFIFDIFYPVQVAEDAVQMDVPKRFTLSTTQKTPCLTATVTKIAFRW